MPDAPQIAYLDVDDTIRATYGYAKQGAGYGYCGVKGLNALLAALSTPASAPVIVATRLRKGSANSARGAARLVADALRTSRACGAGGLLVVRADSAFYGRDVIAAIGRAGARFSVTARQDTRCAARSPRSRSQAWTTIRYPRAMLRRAARAVGQRRPDRRSAVHRVRLPRQKTRHDRAADRAPRPRRQPDPLVPNEQGELFPAWRHHAVFTDSPLTLVQAEADHRRHAIIEQVIADLKNGPLAHLPSGRFNANGAWLVLASMAFNLTRAAGALASRFHARATTATIRRQLINVPARPVRSARRVQLRLPANWPWAADWLDLFTAARRPTRCDRCLTTRPHGHDQELTWKGRADRRLVDAHTHSAGTQDPQRSTEIRSVHPGLIRGFGVRVPGGAPVAGL